MKPLTYIAAIVASILALSSCVPNTPESDVIVPRAIPVSESVTPTLGQINDAGGDLRVIASDQEKVIASLERDLDEALAVASKIEKQLAEDRPVNPEDLETLKAQLINAKAKNSTLEVENQVLKTKIKELETFVDKATAQSIMKDNEVDSLRGNIDTLENQVKSLVDEKNSAIQERDKAIKEAENAGVYKSWVKGIAITIIAYFIIKNLLASYLPQANFLKRI